MHQPKERWEGKEEKYVVFISIFWTSVPAFISTPNVWKKTQFAVDLIPSRYSTSPDETQPQTPTLIQGVNAATPATAAAIADHQDATAAGASDNHGIPERGRRGSPGRHLLPLTPPHAARQISPCIDSHRRPTPPYLPRPRRRTYQALAPLHRSKVRRVPSPLICDCGSSRVCSTGEGRSRLVEKLIHDFCVSPWSSGVSSHRSAVPGPYSLPVHISFDCILTIVVRSILSMNIHARLQGWLWVTETWSFKKLSLKKIGPHSNVDAAGTLLAPPSPWPRSAYALPPYTAAPIHVPLFVPRDSAGRSHGWRRIECFICGAHAETMGGVWIDLIRAPVARSVRVCS